MNKKHLILGAILLVGAITLSGCSVPNDKAEPKPTASVVIKAIPTPEESTIAKSSSLVATANLENGITINSYQEAYGYPSEQQMAYFKDIALPQEKRKKSDKQPASTEKPSSKTTGDKTFSNSPLATNQRVIVIRYEVVNTSSSPVNVKIFTNNLGFFAEDTSISPYAFADASADSLHGKLKISSYPTNFNPESPEWILAPGETATWGLDWLVPKELLSKKEITLIQNFSIGNTWVNGVKLPLKVDGTASNK